MSKETKPKRTRSTKKVSEGESPHTAELEAKIAELEAKLANLSSQVKPAETRPAAQATPKPAPQPEPARPRPAASGPTHGTLPAGMKPTPPPAPKEEPRTESYAAPEVGEVAPSYAQLSSSGYTGNRYYATRARLSYHPPNKQFKGQSASAASTTAPPPPAPEPQPKAQRGTLPAGMKPAETQRTMPAESEKKSLWKAKGAEYENYVSEEPKKAPPPPQAEPKAQRGTLPAGFKSTPPPQAEAPKPAPQPEPARPRPAASGPTHGTLPAGMKPTPPAPKEEPRTESHAAPEVGEVAPAYAQLSSSGYTGNRYYATRRRLSYHPPNKQFTGASTTATTSAPPAPEPPKLHIRRGTLPAGFKPSS